MAKKDIRVDLQIGPKVYRGINFRRAAFLVQGFHQAEYKAYLHLTRRIAADNLLWGFIAESLGMAHPPSVKVWNSTQILLDQAMASYKAGRFPQAVREFEAAVKHRNHVHDEWRKYQSRTVAGGNRAKTICKVTCVIFSLAAGGYASTLWGGAAMSGGLSAMETAGTEFGLYAKGVEKNFDVWKVVIDAGAAFVTSLLFGKLSSAFLGKLNRRLAGGKLFKLDPKSYKEYVALAQASNRLVPTVTKSTAFWVEFFKGQGEGILKTAITTAAQDCRNKKIKMDEFLDYVITKLPAKAMWGHVKSHWDAGS